MKLKMMISLSMIAAAATLSCNNNKHDMAKEVADVKQTEIAFSNKSVKDGLGVAFIAFADSGVVKLNDGAFPILGKEALTKVYSKMKPPYSFTLQWEPVKVEVAESADLAYDYGNWEMKTKTQAGKDTSYYGNYMTVWKKQKDGSWKYVIDGGNSTPKPAGK